MTTQKSLSLLDRFELPHTSLSHPGRFMRLFRPIVRVSSIVMHDIRHQFPVGYTIASQLVR
jgi:hypothetical protein